MSKLTAKLQRERGNLTQDQFDRINRKAHKVLHEDGRPE
jgi:hypothetical protein